MSLNNSSSWTFQFIFTVFCKSLHPTLKRFRRKRCGKENSGKWNFSFFSSYCLGKGTEWSRTVDFQNFLQTFLKDFIPVDLLSSLTVNFSWYASTNKLLELIGGKFTDTKQLISPVSTIVCRINCFSTTICWFRITLEASNKRNRIITE